MVPVDEYDDNHFILMATKSGTVKKTVLTEFQNQRKGGKRAITLEEGDGSQDIGELNPGIIAIFENEKFQSGKADDFW